MVKIQTNKKGFTLVELIVVIAIIGVLSAILVPTMLGFVRDAKDSRVQESANSIFSAANTAVAKSVTLSVENTLLTSYTITAGSDVTIATGVKLSDYMDVSKIKGSGTITVDLTTNSVKQVSYTEFGITKTAS